MGLKASVGPINQAIAVYDKATADPHYVEARWKLMRALYFKGAYTGLDEESRKAVFEKARKVGDDAIAIFESSLEERGIKGFIEFGPDFARGQPEGPVRRRAHVLLGRRDPRASGRSPSGQIDAARKGAADKIRDCGLTVIGIDIAVRGGRGLPDRGSHSTTRRRGSRSSPAGSPDDDAVKYLRLAYQVSARNFANRAVPRRGAPPRRREGPGRGRRARGVGRRGCAVAPAPRRGADDAGGRAARTSRPGRKPRDGGPPRQARRGARATVRPETG